MAETKEQSWQFHAGEDYAVVMRSCESTEDASIRVYRDVYILGPMIAAAPELLEACRKALTCGLDSGVREVICAAIAKAEVRP